MNRDDDYDSDEERRREELLPKYRIRHNDMPIRAMKEIIVCKFLITFFQLPCTKELQKKNRLKHAFFYFSCIRSMQETSVG
jgi:hypothetical protein